ncbi:MAG: DNA repair protein RadC [Clostridiales bacterium]|nr:DNA repair protein RadC [Clostridiales bacterium]
MAGDKPDKTEAVHMGHRQRMKERFLKEGVDSFAPHELLEMLLFFGIPRRDTNEMGHRLLETFGSLTGVLEAPYEELIRVKGITANTAFLIAFSGQLARAYYDDRKSCGTVLQTVEQAGEYLRPKFLGRKEESVYLICLDNRDQVLSGAIVREGSVNAADISVRTVVQYALAHNATQIILSHNHPNGYALPSRADVSTTARIAEALKAVDISLLDHIIVARDDFVSMRETPTMAHLFYPYWNLSE